MRGQPTGLFYCCILVSTSLAFGCSQAPASGSRETAATSSTTQVAASATSTSSQRQATTTKIAVPTMAPPPEGSMRLSTGRLIATCVGSDCPQLLHDAAQEYCQKKFRGGGWRLPSKEDLESLSRLAGLEQKAGYHWSNTPFERDAKQFWIIDPTNLSVSTTLPPTRKPMRTRCIRED